MKNLFATFAQEEAGFVVSAELVLVSTIVVMSLVVGLSEVSNAINQELEDVASAFGSLNQSYHFNGLHGCKAHVAGSEWYDRADECDSNCDITCHHAPEREAP